MARSSGRCYNLADHVLVMEKGEQLRCPPSPRYASVTSIAVTEPQTISCPHARCAMDRIGLHADIDPIPLVRDVPAICLHAPDTILALEPGAHVEQAVARRSEEIGRASGRESVSDRVDLWGRRLIKKTKHKRKSTH